MKKILSMALSLALSMSLIVCFPIVSKADQSGIFTYVVEDERAVITKCTGTGHIDIPEKLGGYPVVEVRMNACSGLNITSVTFPSTIEKIDQFSFNNTKLENVTVPDSVTYLGNGAFYECRSLKTINIGSSVAHIGTQMFLLDYALESITVSADNQHFASKDGLLYVKDFSTLIHCPSSAKIKHLVLPQGLKKIDYRAIYDLKALEEVTIPEGLVEICKEAFQSCEGLKKINLPASLNAIGENAFNFCNSIEEINVAPGNKNYSSQNGVLFNASGSELIKFPQNYKATEYTVPSSVKNITTNAFHDTLNLKKITVPGSIGKIPDYGFFRCGAEEVVLGDGITEIGDWAFCMCLNLTKINIPEGVTRLGNSAFDGDRKIASLTLPSTLKTIGESALLDVCCDFDIPQSVTKIGKYAFRASDITEAVVPKDIAKIEQGTFANCGQLARIFIPKSVKSIAKENFEIDRLKMIYYEGSEAEFKQISVAKDNDAFKAATVVYNSTGIPSIDDHKHNFTNFTTKPSMYFGAPSVKTGYCSICGEKSVEQLDSQFEDKGNGIKITAPVDAYSEPATIEVYPVTEKNEKIGNIRLALSQAADEFVAFDFRSTRFKDLKNTLQPIKPVTITFNIPEGYGSNVGVYYVADDGTIEAIASKLGEDGKTVIAQVSHFSIYALCKLKEGVKTPLLSDDNSSAASDNDGSDGSSQSVSDGAAGDNNGGMPWWIFTIIAAVVICCGGAVFLALNRNKKSGDDKKALNIDE